jgi:hypothetical protein
VNLRWTDNADNEDSFRIERADDAAFTQGSVQATVAADIVSFSDTTVTPGMTFLYRVFAVNAVGESPPSNVVAIAIVIPMPGGGGGGGLDFIALEITAAVPMVVPTTLHPNPVSDTTTVPGGLPVGSIVTFEVEGVVTALDAANGEWQIGDQPVFVYESLDTIIDNAPQVGDLVRVDATRTLAPGPIVAERIIRTQQGPLTPTPAVVQTAFLFSGLVGTTGPSIWTVGGVDFIVDDLIRPAVIDPGLGAGSTATVEFMAAGGAAPPPVAPVAPTDLTATAVLSIQVDLSWTDNADNEDSFRIERADDAAFTQELVQFTIAADVVTFSDTTVTPDTTFFYRVFAVNDGGDSAPSDVVPAAVPEGDLLRFLFPSTAGTLPAYPPWSIPEFTGEPALEPLPDTFDIVEFPAWFDGIPVTVRPFPRPSVGDGGLDDNHADMYVFFYPDGTPVAQAPILEAVPLNAVGPNNDIPSEGAAIAARLFSANWEIHVVRVTQDYDPGSIGTTQDLTNPLLVLEDIQTNIFVTFPIMPQQFTIPGLELNELSVETGTFLKQPVSFVEYDVGDSEFSEKPAYVFRNPSGEFVGNPVVSGIPGMPHYSALWEFFIVEVPEDYVADTLRSEDAVLGSGLPIREGFPLFAPVEAVDGMRTVLLDFMDILIGPDGKFHKVNLPRQVQFPAQPWDNDPRINPATLGFSAEFTFNEVEIPRIAGIPFKEIEDVLAEALRGQFVDLDEPLILPPHIARQRLIEGHNRELVHLSQAQVDTMPLAEIISRGQALFEREIRERDGAGPAFNAYSCAACHGQPFNIAVEPTAGGSGVRFRNALQPTDTPGVKRSRNTPHLFGSGVLTQLGIERHAGGLPATDDNPFPHNWKGTVATLRDFTVGALQGEEGLQAVEKVAQMAGVSLAEAATLDPDGDGKVAEMTVGDVTAMVAFQASLPRPFQTDPSNKHVIRGRLVFENTGCATCHTPVQTLQSTVLELTNPETAGVVRVPLGSATVELFSDLKRHKMGSLLAEPGDQNGIPADVFKTQPLWGIADSGPYLHDGSADTIEEAIVKHGGEGSEALPAAQAFNNLSPEDRDDLLRFLGSLVLPSPHQLQVDAFNSLTSRDRHILRPFLESMMQLVQAGPLLVAWMMNPPPEGTGSVSGTFTVQVSITSEVGEDEALLIVDGTTEVPLVFNRASGFHEAQLDSTALSEGDHRLALGIEDRSGKRGEANTIVSFITVDNVPDTSPLNWPGTWGGRCSLRP